MATEIRRLIKVRTDKGARFKRDGYGKKRQLSDSWRKPRGQHNKQREQKKAKGALPKPGFGSPVAVRGMHPSGYFEVLVTSLKDLEGLDPKTQAVRISANVGSRKRTAIQDQAITAGLRVLNAKVVKTKVKPAKAKPKAEKAGKAEKAKKKAPAKKAAAKPKAEKAGKAEKAEKKAPAKKAAVKPKAEKAEKAENAENTEKSEKAEKKAPAKKAAVKPKAEKTEKAEKAEKKAPAKKAAAKTTKSGVKKNE
jgi:large subunit ribosomal protein L32e